MKKNLPLIDRILLLPANEREALRRRALDPHATTDTFPFVLFMDKGVYPYVQRRNAEYGRESFGRPDRILIALDQIANRQNSAPSSAEVPPDGNRQKAPVPLSGAADSPRGEPPLIDLVPVNLGSTEDSTSHRTPQPELDPNRGSTAPAEPAEESKHCQGESKMVQTAFIGFAAVALLAITGTFITVRIFSSLEKNLPGPAESRQNHNLLIENWQQSSDRIRPSTGFHDAGRIALSPAEPVSGQNLSQRNTATTATGRLIQTHSDCMESSMTEGNVGVAIMTDKPGFHGVHVNSAMGNSKVPVAQLLPAVEPLTSVLEELILRADLKSKPHTVVLGHTIFPGVEITGNFANLCNDGARENRRTNPFRGLCGDWTNIRSLFICRPSLVIFPKDFDRLVEVYRQKFGRAKTDGTWIDADSGLTYIVHGDCLEICERSTP